MLKMAARSFFALAMVIATGCSDGHDPVNKPGRAACINHNPLRNAYFGDLHVHTALSFDSYAFDVRNRPDDAYRFALGEAVSLPPLDGQGQGTQLLRLDRPLDFAAVTDHSEFLGEVDICLSPDMPGYDDPLCETYRENGPLGQTLLGITLISEMPERNAGICGDGKRCLDAALPVWNEIIASAERFNDDSPECSFTTFIGYEYTANTGASAQHRNVIFANETVPFPVSYIEEPGSGGVANFGCVSRFDFVRGALLEGLRERDRIGANPYRLGVIGSTDTHNGTPGAVVEADWIGHRGGVDSRIEDRLGPPSFRAGPVFNPGGVAVVWAEENSRESLFAAMKRREVYGTSGPRILARLFGGWALAEDLCSDPDGIARAYRDGIAMGGELPSPPPGAEAPGFFVLASKDPGTEIRPGTPLQRIQIVKGWVEDGVARHRVFEVAGDPQNGAGVAEDCRLYGEGFDSLCAVWTDPEFSFGQQAFYYARVVENPSCRWTALQCNAAGVAADLESCKNPELVKVLQERAWTSPIWYDAH